MGGDATGRKRVSLCFSSPTLCFPSLSGLPRSHLFSANFAPKTTPSRRLAFGTPTDRRGAGGSWDSYRSSEDWHPVVALCSARASILQKVEDLCPLSFSRLRQYVACWCAAAFRAGISNKKFANIFGRTCLCLRDRRMQRVGGQASNLTAEEAGGTVGFMNSYTSASSLLLLPGQCPCQVWTRFSSFISRPRSKASDMSLIFDSQKQQTYNERTTSYHVHVQGCSSDRQACSVHFKGCRVCSHEQSNNGASLDGACLKESDFIKVRSVLMLFPRKIPVSSSIHDYKAHFSNGLGPPLCSCQLLTEALKCALKK